jgi:hypothetical protein
LASKLPRTELVRSTPDLSGTRQFCFQTSVNSSLLVTSCPSSVVDLYSMSLIPGCTLVMRRGPSNGKMLLGLPSRVASARCLCLAGLLLLAHVTIPLTPAMRRMMSMNTMRGMHPKSATITMPYGTPRRPSKKPSTTTAKLLCMKAASSPRTLSFGLFSTLIGTAPFTFTRRLTWCPLRK